MTDNKALARQFISLWTNRTALEKARPLIDANGTAWMAHTFGVTSGENKGTTYPLPRWIDLLQEAVDLMPEGLHMTLHNLVGEGGWVVAAVESHGHLADGRLYNLHYTFWFNIRDGKIRELKQYFDTKYAVGYFLDYMTRA